MAKSQAMTAKDDAETAMVRPDFIKTGDKRGTDHITRDDIQMPRLALAQSMSPEIDRARSEFIEGLSLGQMFNSLTRQILGDGPLEFFILRADPPRWVEFIPREQGGGVKDPNVPAGDPRTLFTQDDQGNPVLPLATKFYDFIILMLPFNKNDPTSSIIALSFKSTGIKVARTLNGLVQYRNAPLFAGKYSLGVVDEQNAKGRFKNFSVKNAGWADSPETLKSLESLFEDYKDKNVNIDRGEAHDSDLPGDTSFVPSEM